MKVKVTITLVLDSEREEWSEHGKPFGLSRERYLSDIARELVDQMGATMPVSLQVEPLKPESGLKVRKISAAKISREYRLGYQSGLLHDDRLILHRDNLRKANLPHESEYVAKYWEGYLAGMKAQGKAAI